MAEGNIQINLGVSMEQAARGFKRLARALRPFMGVAHRNGYYIENRRGRNRLVPFKKGNHRK